MGYFIVYDGDTLQKALSLHSTEGYESQKEAVEGARNDALHALRAFTIILVSGLTVTPVFRDERMDLKWYVVMWYEKFADGFYGWDASLHSDHQIFEESELPYKPDASGIVNILISVSNIRPSLSYAIEKVNQILDERKV
jgi:hypothetical protein